jgi:hypothetical protein
MSPSASYKDYKGEAVKLNPSGRKNDILPLGISQISNENLYYNPQKFPEGEIDPEPEHKLK